MGNANMSAATPKSFAMFWGCLIPARLPWIEVAARQVLPKLGVDLVDLPFSCCPDPIASKALHHKSWLALAARNLSLAEEKELDILTLCSGCFETLKTAQHELCDKTVRSDINQILSRANRSYQGREEVLHVQQFLFDRVGLDAIRKSVVHPLNLRVASHTGCHFTRPAEILKTDDPIYPEKLDALCEAMGLEPLDYPDKNLCCGVGASLTDSEIGRALVRRKIAGARKAKAHILAAHCPSCIRQFDEGQKQANIPEDERLPVFHLLELLGLAMGMTEKTFAFDAHRCSVSQVLQNT